MEKQTAVEWLALRYHHRQGYLSQEDIEQAKQMEKEQIEKAYYTDCISRPVGVLTPLMPILKPFENYFKERYAK